MKTEIVNVGAYANNPEIAHGLAWYANVRSETLHRCYLHNGYEALPREEKNKMYDRIRAEVEKEMEDAK